MVCESWIHKPSDAFGVGDILNAFALDYFPAFLHAFLFKSLNCIFQIMNEKHRKTMKNFKLLLLLISLLFAACGGKKSDSESQIQPAADPSGVVVDRFADLQVLRYELPDFEKLDLQKKKLVYFLTQAGLSGRDIIYDQNYKHNLKIRRTLEAIYETFPGDRTTEDFKAFEVYIKRVWFSNGIHHHYSTAKITPEFSPEYFKMLINESSEESLPLEGFMDKNDLSDFLTTILFDPKIDAKRVNKDPGVDNVVASANNFYEDITHKEVEAFYASKKQSGSYQDPLWGLNSKLMKENGTIVEKVWKIGGMYSAAIEKIIFWLDKAAEVAENEAQEKALRLLIEYYQTGDLAKFDEYCIAWVQDTASTVDVINGFIEVYGDAIGYKGSFESVVQYNDFEASERMASLSTNAQWFEDNSPVLKQHKKEKVTGISYKVITVAGEAGDAAPSTPVGINLPNSNWIREEYGSKSVSLGNIKDAYNRASSGGVLDEFFLGDEAKQRIKEHKVLAENMHTALHEVIGHASGKLNPGVGTPHETLKTYASTLEEARADLVALYYILDEKLVEIGVIPTTDVGKAEYDTYINNGLMLQLRRLNLGDNIEQDHMRNRQLVARWCLEKGASSRVIEQKVVNGKTYFVINDYKKLRNLFGDLLREIQRIKSEGDYEAGKALVETYGVKVDQKLHKEVLDRYAALDTAPYSGFIQPRLMPVAEGDEITDIKVEYPDTFIEQMLEYGREYSFLPDYN